jgi:hypothetical protein
VVCKTYASKTRKLTNYSTSTSYTRKRVMKGHTVEVHCMHHHMKQSHPRSSNKVPTPIEPALVVSDSNRRIHPAKLATQTRCRSLKVTIQKNEVFLVKERMDLKQITIYRLSSSSYSTTTEFIALNQRKLKTSRRGV